jgi:glycosyltransferase involved in cell wall biosynthesis
MSGSADRRVGYLVSQYPAVTHTFILREIRILRSLGWDIRVVSIRQPDRRPEAMSTEEAEEYRVTSFVLGSGVFQIAAMHVATFFGRPLRYLATFLYAVRLAGWDLRAALQHIFYFMEAVVAGRRLRTQGVEHAHTHFASTVILLVSRLFPITFSVTIHGPDEFNDTEAFHMAEKVAAANLVATISQFASSQVMRASDPRYWHKIRSLPLGVDPEVFAPRPVPPGFEIVCVGRLAPVKAHLVLVAAIARLVAEGRKDLQLVLVGDGPSRSAIEKEIARLNLTGYVRLEGAQNHDRVLEYYRHASVFALASFAEGVPVVLMEAMAMEVPCVATWITGIPELIRNEIDGLLVPPADEAAIASAIARLMDDRELAARLGRSGRLRVLECYALAKNVSRLDAALRELDL